MKKSLYWVLAICLFLTPAGIAAQVKKTVSIHGTVKNFSSQVMVEDLSDMQYLLPPNPERTFIAAADGSFRITFKVASPNYFRLGRNILYLTPGDDLTVVIDNNAPTKAEFSGKGSEANLFLRDTPFPKAGSYMEAGKNAKPTARETVEFLIAKGVSRQKELDAVKGVSAEFKRLETARIKADTINSLNSGKISFYRPKLTPGELTVYDAEYKTLSEAAKNDRNKNFVDFSLMKLVVYRDIADELPASPAQQTDAVKIKEWYSSSSLVNKMSGISNKSELKKLDPEIAAIKLVQYKAALKQRLESLLKFGKGDPALNFVAVDLDGKPVGLESLKGKVIYLDLWATWCGPCAQEMPLYERLRTKYKDRNVAFVSLSIDDNTALWKKNVGDRKADGNQWLISRNKLLDYNVVNIPRTIVIDRDFKVVNLNAPLPSSKETEKMLDELLK
ncbi:MAG: TlpA disulfide reductase family protein [Pyrinomonadaceae bacterium]